MRRVMGGRFKREGTYVYVWLIHIEVWQKIAKFCKAIILQWKINKCIKHFKSMDTLDIYRNNIWLLPSKENKCHFLKRLTQMREILTDSYRVPVPSGPVTARVPTARCGGCGPFSPVTEASWTSHPSLLNSASTGAGTLVHKRDKVRWKSQGIIFRGKG